MGRTILLRTVIGALVASWVAGCATDRLDAAAPSGVNLTGQWALNLNLSDDPDKLGPDPDSTAPKRAPGSHRGHGGGMGRGGGGGMPPIGSSPDGGPTASSGAGYGFVPVALEQSDPVPPSATDSGKTPATLSSSNPAGRSASINRFLRAPVAMSITQDKGSLTVTTNMPDGTTTSDVYTAGEKKEIPFGQDNTAERTAGWRGAVFVVTTSARKFGNREDDFAIDTDDGRLIMTTETRGGKLGKVAITRVYDRVKPGA
jgi:hypothetical protein